jgi:hypothetical protein
VGLKLGRGMKLADIIDSMNGAVAEGVLTSRAAHDLAKKLGVEAPIIDGIHKVIHGAYCQWGVTDPQQRAPPPSGCSGGSAEGMVLLCWLQQAISSCPCAHVVWSRVRQLYACQYACHENNW